jgi:hypothetical protein
MDGFVDLLPMKWSESKVFQKIGLGRMDLMSGNQTVLIASVIMP